MAFVICSIANRALMLFKWKSYTIKINVACIMKRYIRCLQNFKILQYCTTEFYWIMFVYKNSNALISNNNHYIVFNTLCFTCFAYILSFNTITNFDIHVHLLSCFHGSFMQCVRVLFLKHITFFLQVCRPVLVVKCLFSK